MPSCRLCGEWRTRLQRSHVVPRFLLRAHPGADRHGARQTERLLCEVCESALGRIESAAAQGGEQPVPPLTLALLSAIALRAHYSRRTCYARLRLSAAEVAALRKALMMGRDE